MMPLVVAAISVLTTWLFKLDDRVFQLSQNVVTHSDLSALNNHVDSVDREVAGRVDTIEPIVKSNSDWRNRLENEHGGLQSRVGALESALAGHDKLDMQFKDDVKERLDRFEQRFLTLLDKKKGER